ncbi:hypothetical protein EDC04DRAFT_240280 [Pisolithus marmoratus]|nr:hypothetical protein EDC04DRAFT_240280 [Pisolithus marmoratus]
MSSTVNAVNAGNIHSVENLVATDLPDGYWLEAFPFSTTIGPRPDLVGYGLGTANQRSDIKLFQNLNSTSSSGWKKTVIQQLQFPVAITYADLTRNGFNDIIVCDNYGPNMDDLWGPDRHGGRVQWLQNPGTKDTNSHWVARYIGESTGMHRLLAGHFTRSDVTEVLAFPVIPGSSQRNSPVDVILYTAVYGGDPSNGPNSWSKSVPFLATFHLIHDVKLLKGMNNARDMVLIASREGAVALWADVTGGGVVWKERVIGTGLPQSENNPYWGSGSVDFARVNNDDVGYIVTCEAFHGNIVSVYVKDNNTAPTGGESLKDSSCEWKRVQIDDFGPLSAQHTGTIHHVASIKDRTENIESFAVACIGAPSDKLDNQGVYMYSPIDLARGKFRKVKVSHASAARLAISGFTNPDVTDIASISYYVPGYHTGPDPPSVRVNKLHPISVTSLGKEALLRVPRPTLIPRGKVPSMPMITIAGWRLTLKVLHPSVVVELGPKGGVKVIYGSIFLLDGNEEFTQYRTIAPGPKEVSTTKFPSHDAKGRVKAGTKGAIILHVEPIDGKSQGPYNKMSDITTENVFPVLDVPVNVKSMKFPFTKVENLDWGRENFKDFEFYNMTGFYVYFDDEAMDQVVHIQAWTLGLGETARFHNHSDKAFCEVHHCLSNGAEKAGMRYFRDDDAEPVDKELELTKAYVESKSKLLIVPSMYEHGPLWKIQDGHVARPQLRSNGTADYPWHAWLSSEFGDHALPIKPPLEENQQRYDLWLAFEFPITAFRY